MIRENPLRIKYSIPFNKQLKQVPRAIKTTFLEARELFYDNPNHPVLRNHALTEKLAGFSSIDITEDYRALFRIRKTKKETVVTFHKLGTHEQLYGKI